MLGLFNIDYSIQQRAFRKQKMLYIQIISLIYSKITSQGLIHEFHPTRSFKIELRVVGRPTETLTWRAFKRESPLCSAYFRPSSMKVHCGSAWVIISRENIRQGK